MFGRILKEAVVQWPDSFHPSNWGMNIKGRKGSRKGKKTKAVVQWPNSFHPNKNVSLGVLGLWWRSICIAIIIKIPPGLKKYYQA